jgi:hypothetical protein
MRFDRKIASRSPADTPRAASAEAIRLARLSRSPNVYSWHAHSSAASFPRAWKVGAKSSVRFMAFLTIRNPQSTIRN